MLEPPVILFLLLGNLFFLVQVLVCVCVWGGKHILLDGFFFTVFSFIKKYVRRLFQTNQFEQLPEYTPDCSSKL